MKPFIGVTANRYTFPSRIPGPALMGLNGSDDYPHGVETAGGIPVVIPFYENPASIGEVADKLDGLLLAGGEDVNPLVYDEQPRIGLGEVVPERDELEIQLIHAMLERKKPILGICRGIQILNVALGGTLYQDLPREWRGSTLHSQRARRNHLSHTIQVDDDSRLFHLLGDQKVLKCNTFHHQAVKAVAPGFVPVAWDEEGLIEAIERPGEDFIVGVQWHPENLWRSYPVYLGLFKGLVEAARKRG